MIWFGAAVSIAEILTGTYFAPLGLAKGLAAILIGHLIGGIVMFMAGIIGGGLRKSSMEIAQLSFGRQGGMAFAVVNIVQLTGWTAIMIYDGAMAIEGLYEVGNWIWCLIIGGLILVWILIGIQNLGKVNTIAMIALFIMTFVLCVVLWGEGKIHRYVVKNAMSMGTAIELGIAMPLSWLPLISDYVDIWFLC